MQGIAFALIRSVRNTPIAGAQTQQILSLKPRLQQSSRPTEQWCHLDSEIREVVVCRTLCTML